MDGRKSRGRCGLFYPNPLADSNNNKKNYLRSRLSRLSATPSSAMCRARVRRAWNPPKVTPLTSPCRSTKARACSGCAPLVVRPMRGLTAKRSVLLFILFFCSIPGAGSVPNVDPTVAEINQTIDDFGVFVRAVGGAFFVRGV